jgi:hypothetical protein
MAAPKKRVTKRDIKFAALLVDGLTAVDAARKAYRKKCEPGSAEAQTFMDLARSPRILKLVEQVQQECMKQAAIDSVLTGQHDNNIENLHKYAFDRLRFIRDDESNTATVRFGAIQALEQLADPAQDINLIQKYVNIAWDGMEAHCPACHKDFPLWKVENAKLEEYRQEHGYPEHGRQEDMLQRRIYLFNQFEKRLYPHKGQLQALGAPERHIIGMGAARGGKSFLLGMMGMMFFLIPGVEIWILARVYEDARSEFEYIEKFIRSAFYPVDKHMINVAIERKSGEASITSKWGSEIKIKSSKAQGSITGRELEAMLVAEPAWVKGELFEECRARMSSRLGRIISLGTPKGFGGFLGRLVRMTSRDMRTGKRLDEGARLIDQGCPWNQSIFRYKMLPKDNPSYVKSEQEAARGELTVSEYAAEFEGAMVEDVNAKFPWIKDNSLMPIKHEWVSNCAFVLGIDQGERNFGACLLGWDGKRVFVLDEYYDNTDATIKANLIRMNGVIGPTIRVLGGEADHWGLTIFDADPPITGQLYEMEDENREWKSEYTFRPKNIKEFMNWREETCLWANEIAKEGNLIFNLEKCDQVHEQLKDALIAPTPSGQESRSGSKKGWVINDPWRGEHVPDAWLLAMWTLYNHMLILPSQPALAGGPFDEAKKAFEFKRLQSEKNDLAGFNDERNDPDALFEDVFGRPRRDKVFSPGVRGHYRDES